MELGFLGFWVLWVLRVDGVGEPVALQDRCGGYRDPASHETGLHI